MKRANKLIVSAFVLATLVMFTPSCSDAPAFQAPTTTEVRCLRVFGGSPAQPALVTEDRSDIENLVAALAAADVKHHGTSAVDLINDRNAIHIAVKGGRTIEIVEGGRRNEFVILDRGEVFQTESAGLARILESLAPLELGAAIAD